MLSCNWQDEVRALGRLPALNVPEAFITRHPFPGAGSSCLPALRYDRVPSACKGMGRSEPSMASHDWGATDVLSHVQGLGWRCACWGMSPRATRSMCCARSAALIFHMPQQSAMMQCMSCPRAAVDDTDLKPWLSGSLIAVRCWGHMFG